MKKILLLFGIVIMLSIQVFSVDYNCDNFLNLENFSNNNNINLNEDCYGIKFEYKDLNNQKVVFNIQNNNYSNKNPLYIYDNTINYNNENENVYEFRFNNFDNIDIKYSSELTIIKTNYTNKNKFYGNNADGKIYIENILNNGKDYFITGSFNNFNNLQIHFENFINNDERGEYRIFLNDINNVDIYAEMNNKSNEKILVIENNVNKINLINIDENDYRIKTITFEEFMSLGYDNIYMKNIPETIKKEDVLVSNNENKTNQIIKNEIIKIYEENKYPFGFYIFGLLVVFISTFIARRNEKMIIKSKGNIALNLTLALIPSLLVLLYTKNGFLSLVSSILFSSIYSIIYYRNDMKKKTFIRFIIQTIVVLIIIGISYLIYNLIV